MIPKPTVKFFVKILFAPLLWLVNACSPLGNPVDEEKSDSHYYNNDKTDIQYSRMGNWFELGNSAMNADVESFEVMTRFISRDKNRFYFKEDPVKSNSINRNSFYVKDDYFMTDLGFDNEHVYLFEYARSNDKNVVVKKIEHANPKLFSRKDWSWANDGKYHFYENQVISVDFDSFENIDRTFSKDKNQAYMHYYQHFQPIEANVKSFKVLRAGEFAMDNLHVFSMTYSLDEQIGTQLVTINREPNEKVSVLNEVFLKIGNRVFFRGSYLEELDVNTLEIFNLFYIKDKDYVYYKDVKLEDADAATFGKKGKRGIGDKDGTYSEGVREQ